MEKPSTPLLEVKDLTKIFSTTRGIFGQGEIRAVDHVSFTLPSTEPTLLTMVGESGSGKTTITRAILGLSAPSSGEILYKGTNVLKLKGKQWADYRRQVQVVFQDPYGTYNPFYKIERVLQVVIKKFGMATSKDQEMHLIEEALKSVELRPKDIIGHYPHQLSGGERQRVMLARISLLAPQLIIADEPVSMIDVSLRAAFLNILLNFKQQYGMSCIFITHD
ncbi:MAG: ABC transporter ATP-binding protein, partial [Anaerolineaceae bacterium]|nr:ABC transporter ATP-binding protein [Anaerolineaceae bacterium]